MVATTAMVCPNPKCEYKEWIPYGKKLICPTHKLELVIGSGDKAKLKILTGG